MARVNALRPGHFWGGGRGAGENLLRLIKGSRPLRTSGRPSTPVNKPKHTIRREGARITRPHPPPSLLSSTPGSVFVVAQRVQSNPSKWVRAEFTGTEKFMIPVESFQGKHQVIGKVKD